MSLSLTKASAGLVCAFFASAVPAWADTGVPHDIANTQITLRGMILPDGGPTEDVVVGTSSVAYHATAVPRRFIALRTTPEGRNLIRQQEGLRLKAYRGASGMWLIGYGHAGTARKGMKITLAEAEALLRRDLREHEENIARVVKVPITSNELSGMVSLSYTIGVGAFAKSSVVRYLNAGEREKAADAFLLWNKYTRNGKKRKSTYLAQRRLEERALFVKPHTEPRVTFTTASNTY